MTPLDTFRSPWLPSERRALTERRAAGERRRDLVSVALERRRPTRRRTGLDRRESAVGHVRNALQVLQELSSRMPMDGDLKLKLESSIRRLWLAVAEAERPGPTASSR